MRKFKYKQLWIFCFLITSISCRKSDYQVFTETDRIQFGPQLVNYSKPSFEYQDSLKEATFIYYKDDITTDTIYFDVYTMGGISKVNRTYKIEQIDSPDSDNAVAGKHFIPFDDPELAKSYVIPADSVHARVPVVIIRDPELKQKNIYLSFKLVENDFFKLGENKKLSRKLQIADRLSKPSGWSSTITKYYFGAYTIRKHQFMIDSTGKRWDETYFSEVISNPDLLEYYVSLLGTELINYNNLHPDDPLKDENGELVTFPNY